MKRFFFRWYCSLLGKLARGYIRKHNPYIIGINGSVGKTTCRFIIAQTLKKTLPHEYRVYSSPTNFNGELGMSLTVFRIEKYIPTFRYAWKTLRHCFWKRWFEKKLYDCILLEYGVDHPGEMDFLLSIAKPHIGVFTKIDSVHTEQFGDSATIVEEETKMIKNTQDVAFLNADDVHARNLYDSLEIKKYLYTTTQHDAGQAMCLFDVDYIFEGFTSHPTFLIESRLKIFVRTNTLHVKTNLAGKENFGYIALAFGIVSALYRKITQNSFFEDFALGTSDKKTLLQCDYKLLPGRFTLLPGLSNSIVIDSTYNASPVSVRKVIQTATTIKNQVYPTYKILLLLGDMKELGSLTEKEHKELAVFAQTTADHFVLVGESMQHFFADELVRIGRAPKDIMCASSAIAAGKYCRSFLEKSADTWIVVCKGSQNNLFLEEAVKWIVARKHHHEHFHTLSRQSKWWKTKKKKFFSRIPSQEVLPYASQG